MVQGLARRYLALSQGDIDDAVQDVFIEIWRCAGRFTPGEHSSEAAFIATIAHRRLIDAQRRLASRPRPSEAASHDGAIPARALSNHDGSDNEEDIRLAAEALDQLPDPLRDVMYLSFHSGLSHAGIAERVGLPIGTVKTRLRRGLHEIRLRLSAGTTPSASHGRTEGGVA